MTHDKDPSVILQVSFSLDWIDDFAEIEMPFVKEEMSTPQSPPQTVKIRKEADGADFWCSSKITLSLKTSEGVNLLISYAYSHSVDEIRNNDPVRIFIPYGKDGHGKEGEMGYEWKWVNPKQLMNLPAASSGVSFCRAGTVDEGDLPAARLEGIVPQPFQPYKLANTATHCKQRGIRPKASQ